MTQQFQTVCALLIAAAATIWLVLRGLAKRKKPGCGGDCGCATGELKAKALPRDKAR